MKIDIKVLISLAGTVLVALFGFMGTKLFFNAGSISTNKEAISSIRQDVSDDVKSSIDDLKTEIKSLGVDIVELRLSMERSKLEQLTQTVKLTKLLIDSDRKVTSNKAWPILPVPLPKGPKIKEAEKDLPAIEKRMIEQRKLVESLEER